MFSLSSVALTYGRDPACGPPGDDDVTPRQRASASATILGTPAKRAQECGSLSGVEVEMSESDVIEVGLHAMALARATGDGEKVRIGEHAGREREPADASGDLWGSSTASPTTADPLPLGEG